MVNQVNNPFWGLLGILRGQCHLWLRFLTEKSSKIYVAVSTVKIFCRQRATVANCIFSFQQNWTQRKHTTSAERSLSAAASVWSDCFCRFWMSLSCLATTFWASDRRPAASTDSASALAALAPSLCKNGNFVYCCESGLKQALFVIPFAQGMDKVQTCRKVQTVNPSWIMLSSLIRSMEMTWFLWVIRWNR